MFDTERTKAACQLLISYARTPEQKMVVDDTCRQLLAQSSSEDQVVLIVTGFIQDGLRFGNWLWITPEARRVKP